jgi:putative transposase
VAETVVTMATANPWYGCKKIAVMCRRAGKAVTDREAFVVMRDHGLLRGPWERAADLYQAARLFELLQQQPNDQGNMDSIYINIPSHGWWYAVTVINYYSRYLLACHLTFSYSATQVTHALTLARVEAERVGGPLAKRPFLVTDNGPPFTARRFVEFIREPLGLIRKRAPFVIIWGALPLASCFWSSSPRIAQKLSCSLSRSSRAPGAPAE